MSRRYVKPAWSRLLLSRSRLLHGGYLVIICQMEIVVQTFLKKLFSFKWISARVLRSRLVLGIGSIARFLVVQIRSLYQIRKQNIMKINISSPSVSNSSPFALHYIRSHKHFSSWYSKKIEQYSILFCTLFCSRTYLVKGFYSILFC